MLAKEFRLKGKKNFDQILQSPNVARGQFLYVKFIKNNLSQTRFGLIISNKISPLANKRNYTRRLLRQVLMENKKNINPGFDVVILAKSNIIGIKLPILREDLEKTLTQIKILNSN
jgi:ribonuclease P protein component